MKFRTLIFRSLIYYRRTHLGVLLGAIISTTILAGALIVGDSVRYSLKQIVFARLGQTEFALSVNDRFFRNELAAELAKELNIDIAPILHLKGIASSDGGNLRVNQTQIHGVNSQFWKIGNADLISTDIIDNEVIINQHLAVRLNLQVGKELLLRIEKPNLLPGDAPFSSRENNTVAMRLKVKDIATDKQFGRFSLETSQVSPFSVFLSYTYLAEQMGLQHKANILLAAKNNNQQIDTQFLNQKLTEHWKLGDAELKIRELPRYNAVELISDHVFISPPIEKAILETNNDVQKIFTYFVNSIKLKNKETPYSFISAPGAPIIPKDMADNEIIITEWLANDLDAAKGDNISLTYYVLDSGYELHEDTSQFKVKAIIPIKDRAADKNLMPMFPGLSDSDNCRDWDPGIPVDLDKIRDKDEIYWDKYHGIPKAYITLNAAQNLWSNRYGALTAIRFLDNIKSQNDLENKIMSNLDPTSLGLFFKPVLQEALSASNEAVDFGQLFIGLSFFIVAAALLLTGLLFVLSTEQRSNEMGILLSIGFTPKQVKKVFLSEGAIIAIIGGIIGTGCGIFYNQAILYALGTLWHGAVGTSALILQIKPMTLFIGSFSGIILAILTMWLTIRKQTQKTVHELQVSTSQFNLRVPERKRSYCLFLVAACFLGVLVILFMISPGKDKSAAGAFWGAGSLMLIGSLTICFWLIARLQHASQHFKLGIKNIGLRNTSRRKGRSIATIALLSCGIFIIIGVGANRLNSLKNAQQRNSGTGGFAFYGETTMPVRQDLNSEKEQRNFGLHDSDDLNIDFVQLRVRDGDDASCLNLNRIKHPRIVGVKPENLAIRKAFSFVALSEGLDAENPWLNLNLDLGENIIPAVADQGVIIWGLGKTIGDVLTYTDEHGHELKVKLIGGLASTILQGNIIISEENFINHFPAISGSKILLIDNPPKQNLKVMNILNRSMQDYGLELTPSAERLAAFFVVENTYLTIFLALGGLGLILGTIGIGIIVLRNVMERRSELALLRAVGLTRESINRMLLTENFLLLIAGVCCGTISAIIAVLPSILSPGAEIPYLFISMTLLAIIINGSLWTIVATKLATKQELISALRSE